MQLSQALNKYNYVKLNNKIMMFKEQLDARNIAIETNGKYTIARTSGAYATAEDFAIRVVYGLKPYLAKKLNIASEEMVLVAISKNNKVVVFCDNSQYRDWLYPRFGKPSLGHAQFYDDVAPELILKKLKELQD